jgi:hypothetical protein
LSGVQSHAYPQGDIKIGSPGVCGGLLAESKRRQYRTPSVILLHSRDTEYGHDVITRHVLNRAAIPRHFSLCETV